MAVKRGDKLTLDLLEDWTPPEIVQRYDEERLRTATLRAKLARAVSETLKESDLSREEIASKMSDWLEEDVSRNMLDAYASEAREEHTITYLRIIALIHVTGDSRIMQIGADRFGHIVVDKKYQKWINVGMAKARQVEVERLNKDIDRQLNDALRDAKTVGS